MRITRFIKSIRFCRGSIRVLVVGSKIIQVIVVVINSSLFFLIKIIIIIKANINNNLSINNIVDKNNSISKIGINNNTSDLKNK